MLGIRQRDTAGEAANHFASRRPYDDPGTMNAGSEGRGDLRSPA
jgi:hypothetical protein